MRKSLVGKKVDKNFKPLNIWEVNRRIYNDLGLLDLYPENRSEERLEEAYKVLLPGEEAKKFNTTGEPYLITSYGRVISHKGRALYPINYVSKVTGEVKQFVNLYSKTYDLHDLFVDAGFDYDAVRIVRMLRKYGEIRMANHSPELPF
jgi:hypothetical protein